MADFATSMAIRERRNWMIHLLYVRNEHKECMALIEEQLLDSQGLCEYAIFVKALIRRLNGLLQESLTLFQAAALLNPQSVTNLKQVGRSLYLLGRHKNAIEIYEEARTFAEDDWELVHNIGLCHMYLKSFDRAEECFVKANVLKRHDCTYYQLGKLYTMQERYQDAIDTFVEALEFSPENPELLTTLGLLFLRTGENHKAFEFLGNALTIDPRNVRSILAAGSIIQDNGDWDVALSKYRIAAVHTPNSAQLWNNIGMCFFGKKNYIAAVSSLRKAISLAPFEWIMAYNLGIVFLHCEQYASAFHYLSASINLKSDFASTYMYLGIALSHLDDVMNACAAYDRAISMEQDPVFELNYAVMLHNHGHIDQAKLHLAQFDKLFRKVDEEARKADPEVAKTRDVLAASLQ